MSKKTRPSQILLRWSDYVPSTDVQDPLGLGLRGSTRLASRLLYCITSITPRARYFSFIPWCIYDHTEREKGLPYAYGLRDGIILREQALTLGSIAFYEGENVPGGGLVGSREARKWYAKSGENADFKKIMKKQFSKNHAVGQYLNSLVNLGMFKTEVAKPDMDEEEEHEELTFDDIQLSEIGLELAKRFDRKISALTATKALISKDRTCTVESLKNFGKHAGLSELSQSGADRELLRDIFFAKVETKGESHPVRRQSLLLTMQLCHQLSAEGWALDEPRFGGAVYFGEVCNEESRLNVSIPAPLADIAMRWRMFYFHHFMAVALEALFAWLVSQLSNHGLAGQTVSSLVQQISEGAVAKQVSEVIGVQIAGNFGDLTPSQLFVLAGVSAQHLDVTASKIFDQKLKSLSSMAEDSLEFAIRGGEYHFGPTGLALPMILLTGTLSRFSQWENTDYGKWLANVANDPYLDLVPPLITTGLARRFGDWWNTPYSELTSFTLTRYIIQQHQSMSYEKTWSGERCLLQVDGNKVVSTGGFDKIGLGNPRLRSSFQILADLGLMEHDEESGRKLTPEGENFLSVELGKEAKT
jgi:hypothetical protein